MKSTGFLLAILFLTLFSCASTAEISSSSEPLSSLEDTASSFSYEEGVPYSYAEYEETLPYLSMAIGEEAALVLPSYPASSYEVSLFEESGILVASLSCKGVSTKALDLYPSALREIGYRVAYDSSYAYQKASATEDRIVEFALEEETKGYALNLLLYVYPSRLDAFPSDFSDALLGEGVLPPLEGEAYAAAYFPEGYGLIEVYGIDEAGLSAYESSLPLHGWSLASKDAYSSTYAALDGTCSLTLYLSYDAYDAPMALLRLENAWPRVYLLSLLGEDLPRLEGLPFAYAFVGESGILTLYFDGATREYYRSYVALLGESGYAPYEEGSYESEALSSTIFYSYARKGDKEIAVLYNESSGTIAVPVYGEM